MIAILGATGYIGFSLSRLLAASRAEPLTLVARAPERLSVHDWPATVKLERLDSCEISRFDLIINALGVGDPRRTSDVGAGILEITRRWDDLCISAMRPDARYVFLSSGAVYGVLDAPAQADTCLSVPLNAPYPMAPYAVAKLIAELGHRQRPDRSVLDVRVFGYADRAVDLQGSSFLAQLADSLRRQRPFITAPDDMIRDYCGALELWRLIEAWTAAGAPNGPLDLYSRAPLNKSDLLAFAQKRYGCEVVYSDDVGPSPTGVKPFYASSFRRAADFGYAPARDAMAVVTDVLGEIVGV